MQRLAGRPLPKVSLGAMARILADLQARLHDLDPVAFLRAVTRDGLEPRSLTFDAHLAYLTERAARGGLGGLTPGLGGLAPRPPPPPQPRARRPRRFPPLHPPAAPGR